MYFGWPKVKIFEMPEEAFVLIALFFMGTLTALIVTSFTLYCLIFSHRFKYSTGTIAPSVIQINAMEIEESNISAMDSTINFGGIWIGENEMETSTVSDHTSTINIHN